MESNGISMSSLQLDPDMILSLKDILGDNFNSLIGQFQEDGQRRIDALGPAVRNKDFDTINKQAHGLKGSARNLGANALAEHCDVLEIAGRNEVDEKLETSLAAVEQSFAAAMAELEAHRS